LMLTIVLIMVLALAGTAGAQEGRTGQTKDSSISMQSFALSSSLNVDVTPSAGQLAGLLVGTGPTAPTISNVVFTGNSLGSGSFSGGTGAVGLEGGIVLGSGQVSDVVGPNTLDATTTDFGRPGDTDLNGLIPDYSTFDAAVLEFDFECPEGTGGEDVISFQYVFTSEEYNEYVNSAYNDVFGFFLNGTNIALLPDGVTPVSINNVNNGYSAGGSLPGINPSNPAYFINNDLNNGGPFIDIEADGLTVVLGVEANVNPGVSNHLRLAIADAGDHVLDSWVFIKEGSFVCAPLNQPPVADPNGPYVFPLNAGPFDGSASSDPDGDQLTYSWDFGNGFGGTGVTPMHSYAAAGIYDVCLTVNDGFVDSAEACTYAVVYDPSGGFVTGGGWIDSPAEAMSRLGAVWDQDFSTDASGWFGDGITVDGGVAELSFPGGQFSRFDGYRDVWPGTYTAEIDVYLDPSWPADQGFDYSVASNGSDGQHQRDFIFHIGTVENYGPIVGKELLVAVDNNAYGDTNPFVLTTRPGGYYVVPTAGWYTLQHVFYDAGGYLAVDFNILDSNGTVVWSDTRSDTSDTIPGEVGGNRYAWFAHIDVAAGIQVDNHQLFMDIPGPEGKATFGFVSKYKKGATVPDGNTEFQFKAGDLNFHSTSYEWLVVTGSNFAKFKGEGTINGQGNYKFQIWAGDGAQDTFRIKIWYEDGGNEVIVYDNGMNQPIGNGSIVVHSK